MRSLHEERRDFLRSLGYVGIGAALAGPLAATADSPVVDSRAGVCVVTPEQTEGPYYLPRQRLRSDITEGKAGVPLSLAVTVVDVQGCQPITGAAVDIWHCDAQGIYSGYDNAQPLHWGRGKSHNDSTFLRGVQITDQRGVANFRTLYPGCYTTRTTHVHAKIYLSERELLTTQFYFPDEITDHVYANSPHYRSQRDTRNNDDRIMRRAGATQTAMLQLRQQAGGYAASLIIGVVRG